MPIPEKKPNENNQDFIARCMSNDTMKKEYSDTQQRLAICLGQTRNKGSLLDRALEALGFLRSFDSCEECQSEGEIVDLNNIFVPEVTTYVDFGEETEDLEIPVHAKYRYVDPVTREIYYFEYKGNYKKNNRYLRYDGQANAAEYQGRKVTLNKPFRTSDGPKKFAVYTKNEKGTVVIVRFGDPNMKIKKNIPERRKSFRARHNCDNPGPKWKARYWSCKMW
jgi:hypothetical protein